MERRSGRRARRHDRGFDGRTLGVLVLGAALVVSAVLVVSRGPWLVAALGAVPKEEEWTRSSAMLFAGAVALASLTAAAYLSFEERRKVRRRRDK